MKTMSETGVRAYARASRVVADAIHAKADSTLRRIQVRLALRYCVGNPARGLSCLVAIAVSAHALDAETARMADAIMEDIDPTEQDLELRDSYSRTIWRIAYQNRSDAPLDDGSTVEEVSQTEGDPTLRDLDDADSGEQPHGDDASESVALVVPEDPTASWSRMRPPSAPSSSYPKGRTGTRSRRRSLTMTRAIPRATTIIWTTL